MDLSVNQLRGQLPSKWSSISYLSELYLNNNQLSGSIPSSIGARTISTVDISNNQFCGCVSRQWNSSYFIQLNADPAMRLWNCSRANACAVDEFSTPAERATLAFLQGFAVSMPSLQSTWADTRYCAWPGVTCNTDDTVTLDFSGAALAAAGSVPELSDSVNGSLVAVTQIQISGKGAMVSGSLPASWGRLTRLTEVTLAGNALTGPLPAAWAGLTVLETLNLESNQLSQSLPAEWSALRRLQTLRLSANAITGTLPETWRVLLFLSGLYLNSNRLTGSIPAAMGPMPLSTVDISSNAFCGCVPVQWNSSSSVTLTADAAVRAADCAAANACPVVEASSSGSSSTADEMLTLTAEQRSTLLFLRSFATAESGLGGVWTGTDYCQWRHVSCGSTVVSLNFASPRLTGRVVLPELPDEVNGSLVVFTSVRAYDLGDRVSGTLPASWWRLARLTEVKLSGNGLHGSLPAAWGGMTALQTVELDGNQLSGALPAAWSKLSSVRVLSVADNALSGTLPSEYGALATLQTLMVGVNQLSGTLPAAWGGMTALRYLHVNRNQLSGSIPAELGTLGVWTVDVSGNNLCGCAPATWTSTAAVTLTADPELRAANCSKANACTIEDTPTTSASHTARFLEGLSAAVPALQGLWTGPHFCRWAGVTCDGAGGVALDLSALALTAAATLPEMGGDVDGSLVAVTLLRIANHSGMVAGRLPASWARLAHLQAVDVSGNALSGSLPPEWGTAPALASLALQGNELSGALPEEWASLATLTRVDLGSNMLTGTLPSAWASMRSLSSVTVQYNQLSGSLPPEWGTAPALTSVNVRGNALCGCVPASWSALTVLADTNVTTAACMTVNTCAAVAPPTSAAPAERAAGSSGRDLTPLWAVLGALGGCLVAAAVVLVVRWCRRRAAAKKDAHAGSSEPYGDSEVSM